MKTKVKSLVVSHSPSQRLIRAGGWSLLAILVLAAILRLWKLNTIPPGLTPDEASLGYNAYSILKTGRDEYGEFFPMIFKSFGDYKPGLYVYATIPFVALFGLNEWSVRLPSAIAGVILVWLVFKIISQLTTHLTAQAGNSQLANLTALMAAISPWLIHFSRGAWEANLSLTLTLAGIYFFLRSFHKSYFLLPTSVSFALTFLTYQGAKLSTTLVVLVLAMVFWKEVKVWFSLERPRLLKSALVGVVIVLPILVSLLQGKTGRLEVFSVFSYPRSVEYTQSFLSQGKEKIGDFTYYLFHSESLNFARGVAGRWFNHFSGKYLFFEGDYQNPRHSLPNHGMLLLIDLLLLPLGIFYLLKTKDNKLKTFTILWLLLSPLPAVLSRDQVQAVRALNMAIPLVITTSLGLYYLITLGSKSRFKYAINFILYTIYISSFAYFLDAYFTHLPIHNAKYWYYGYKQAVQETVAVQDDYEKVYFQQSYDQPYIYFLFFTKYDPLNYQSSSKLVDGGIDVGLVERLDNVEFKDLSWPPPVGNEKTLVVGNTTAIPDYFSRTDYNLIKEVKYPDGYSTAFRIIETKRNY